MEKRRSERAVDSTMLLLLRSSLAQNYPDDELCCATVASLFCSLGYLIDDTPPPQSRGIAALED